MSHAEALASEPPLFEFDPEMGDHEQLERLRAQAPIARSPMGTFLLFRHADATRIIDDGSTRQLEMEGMFLQGITEGAVYDFHKYVMLFANGETHTRRRAPAARTFAYKLMDGMRGEIVKLSEGMIEARKGAGVTDFLGAVAGVIPATLIARILGVPAEDRERFTAYVLSSSQGLGLIPEEDFPRIEKDTAALVDYVENLLAERRKNPQEDFLTDYVQKVDGDGILSPEEIRMQVAGLILAGSDTTRSGMCSVLSQLLQHPEQWEAFCADPDGLKKQVVAEGLRYDPPVASLPRVSVQDIEIGGYHIPNGSIVAPSLLAALRDPEIYTDPHTFDIHRTDHPRWHLAFGHGAHRCLGEALARAEMEEVLASVARLAPGTTLEGTPPRLRGVGAIRQIDRMEVAFA